MPANGITCTETINGNNVQISGKIPDADGKRQVGLIVSTDVNNVNENNIVHIDQKTSTTAGKFNFAFTLPQNPADVNYGYIIGTNADVDSYIGTISTVQPDDEEITKTITCTETVDGNNVQISGQIPNADGKRQVGLIVSTDVDNVNENNIVYIDQTASTTSGKFKFTFTLPQSSSITSYGYIIGTNADVDSYIGVINIQPSGNEDDDDDNDHGGDTDITGTTVTVKYYLGADGVFAQTDTDGTSYLLKNGHGDTVTIVRNGNVVDDAEYDAYGNVKNSQTTTSYTYANYYYDSHSGMYYLRNRFYDPSIARFISEDPIQDGINWYAYCGGNPIMYVDPTGMIKEGDDELDESIQIILNGTKKDGSGGLSLAWTLADTDAERKAIAEMADKIRKFNADNINRHMILVNTGGAGGPGHTATLLLNGNDQGLLFSYYSESGKPKGEGQARIAFLASDEWNNLLYNNQSTELIANNGTIQSESYNGNLYLTVSAINGKKGLSKIGDIYNNPGEYNLGIHNCDHMTSSIATAAGIFYDKRVLPNDSFTYTQMYHTSYWLWMLNTALKTPY